MLFCAAVCGLSAAASAVPVLQSGTYALHNHPAGAQAPPPYGLRLDGLDGNNSHVFSFDFDDSRSNMRMTVDLSAGTIRIFGTVYGGRDVGSSYAGVSSGRVGLWQVEFTFRTNVQVQSDGDIVVRPMNPATNYGYIQPLFASTVSRFRNNPQIHLADYNSNSAAASFILETNHRGFAGVSGYGWLTHSHQAHVPASDWLFTVGQATIPTPAASLLACIGFATCGVVRRRLAH